MLLIFLLPTTLLVVHHISDRIAVMYLGRIVEIADADDLNESPIHPYTQFPVKCSALSGSEVAKERQRIILEGDVPSPLNMPTGCAFRTRCKYATERCAKECPTLTDEETDIWWPALTNKSRYRDIQFIGIQLPCRICVVFV